LGVITYLKANKEKDEEKKKKLMEKAKKKLAKSLKKDPKVLFFKYLQKTNSYFNELSSNVIDEYNKYILKNESNPYIKLYVFNLIK
jgi:hypothetical protein